MLATVMDDGDDDITMPAGPWSVCVSGVLRRIPASRAREHGGKAQAPRRPEAHTPSLGCLHSVLFHVESVSVVLEDAFKMMRAYF